MVKRGATQEVAEAVAIRPCPKLPPAPPSPLVRPVSRQCGVNTRDTVLGMSFDELSGSDTFRQAFTRIDQDQQTQHSLMRKSCRWPGGDCQCCQPSHHERRQGVGAAAVSSMMGDAMLFKMLAGKAATGGVLKGAAKGRQVRVSAKPWRRVQQYAVNESLNEVAAADIDPMKGSCRERDRGRLDRDGDRWCGRCCRWGARR